MFRVLSLLDKVVHYSLPSSNCTSRRPFTLVVLAAADVVVVE